ncbi:hypothetical protein NQZ68_040175, partial [Dissostichus eleginoides]
GQEEPVDPKCRQRSTRAQAYAAEEEERNFHRVVFQLSSILPGKWSPNIPGRWAGCVHKAPVSCLSGEFSSVNGQNLVLHSCPL